VGRGTNRVEAAGSRCCCHCYASAATIILLKDKLAHTFEQQAENEFFEI